jgi:hypothetical protein
MKPLYENFILKTDREIQKSIAEMAVNTFNSEKIETPFDGVLRCKLESITINAGATFMLFTSNDAWEAVTFLKSTKQLSGAFSIDYYVRSDKWLASKLNPIYIKAKSGQDEKSVVDLLNAKTTSCECVKFAQYGK